MASTYSPSLRIELIGTGDQSGIWGDTTNNNLGGLIEQAIAGVVSIPMTDNDYTLTVRNGSVDEARNAVLVFTSVGALTGSRNIIIPAQEKIYSVKNTTTGGQNLVVKTSSGTGYTVPNGKTAYIYCDGLDCYSGVDYVPNLELTGVPTAPTAAYGTNTTQVATTAFVQAALQALYPVGSVYINAGVDTNPATLFGFGTWVSVGDGKVLVNQDATDTAFDTLGETGGSKDATLVSHTHTASTEGNHTHGVNDPGHVHSYTSPYGSGAQYYPVAGNAQIVGATTGASATGISIQAGGAHTHTISTEGSSATNANLQPYVVVKMWKRTA